MKDHSVLRRFILMVPDKFYKIRTHLSDVIGYESRRRRGSLRLAEGIKLHGAEEVQCHLADLVRCLRRQESQQDTGHDFNSNQHGIPSQDSQSFDGFSQDF